MNNSKLRNRMGQIPLEKEFKGLRAYYSVFKKLLHFIARSLPMYPGWRAALHRFRGVRIGKNVFIGIDVFIDSTYPEIITIEDSVTIVARTFIIGHSFNPIHLEKVLNKNNAPKKQGVIFRKGCYVGAQSIILPGVEIGECSIIGAGSVVTEPVPAYSVAVGVPAKVIKSFSKQDVMEEYL